MKGCDVSLISQTEAVLYRVHYIFWSPANFRETRFGTTMD